MEHHQNLKIGPLGEPAAGPRRVPLASFSGAVLPSFLPSPGIDFGRQFCRHFLCPVDPFLATLLPPVICVAKKRGPRAQGCCVMTGRLDMEYLYTRAESQRRHLGIRLHAARLPLVAKGDKQTDDLNENLVQTRGPRRNNV